MNDFINKISLYDQLGYIAVGGLFYGCILFDLFYFNFNFEVVTSNSFLIGVLIYFLGHMAQAIANQLIKENKTDYSISQKKILIDIKKYFSVEEETDNNAFGICYLWSISNDKTGHIISFNANYGLYRGWTIVLLIQSVILFSIILTQAFHCDYSMNIILGLNLCLILAFLTFKRSERFYKYISAKVFQTFIIYGK
jgi:hypothetical protein